MARLEPSLTERIEQARRLRAEAIDNLGSVQRGLVNTALIAARELNRVMPRLVGLGRLYEQHDRLFEHIRYLEQHERILRGMLLGAVIEQGVATQSFREGA